MFPTLLLVMLGIIDFGFLFQRYEVVTNAAREGARMAILPDYAAKSAMSGASRSVSGGRRVDGSATVTVGAPQAVAVGSQCITVRPVTVCLPDKFLFLGPIVGLMGRGWRGT